MRMGRVSTLVLVLLAPVANAADWQSLGKNNVLSAYVDVSSIQQRDGKLVADVLMDYFAEQPADEATSKPYSSVVMRSAYDCQLERTTTITISLFSGPTASGERVAESVMKNVDSNWLPVPPTSLRRQVFTFVCAKAAEQLKTE